MCCVTKDHCRSARWGGYGKNHASTNMGFCVLLRVGQDSIKHESSGPCMSRNLLCKRLRGQGALHSQHSARTMGVKNTLP